MKINPLNKITNSELVNKHIKKAIENDTFAAKTLVTINVAKDVFAYGARFATTMNNKEIPEEKRPFVASMDLMSGVVTAAMQIGVGFSLANPKFQDKIWDKTFKNCKFNDVVAAKKGFSQILALIGSTILAERILVPLIATPAAEQFEKKVMHHNPQSKQKKTQSDFYNELNRITFSEFEADIKDGRKTAYKFDTTY
ncbi:MAG: hypothetical protein IJY61_04695 [Candidatus Gastranaerophilales bacterium]|nr:hypothetical protein [Candidatus Gastranaerophilales bacterium]